MLKLSEIKIWKDFNPWDTDQLQVIFRIWLYRIVYICIVNFLSLPFWSLWIWWFHQLCLGLGLDKWYINASHLKVCFFFVLLSPGGLVSQGLNIFKYLYILRKCSKKALYDLCFSRVGGGPPKMLRLTSEPWVGKSWKSLLERADGVCRSGVQAIITENNSSESGKKWGL